MRLQLICYQKNENENNNTIPLLDTIRIAKIRIQSTDSTYVDKDTEQKELSLLAGTAIV